MLVAEREILALQLKLPSENANKLESQQGLFCTEVRFGGCSKESSAGVSCVSCREAETELLEAVEGSSGEAS